MSEHSSKHSSERPSDLSEEANQLLADLEKTHASPDDSGKGNTQENQHHRSGNQSDNAFSSLLLFGFAGLASALVLGVIGLVILNEQRQAVEIKKAELAQLEASRLQREQAAREQAAREQAARDQAAREQAAREQSAREQAARDQAAREQAAREQEATEQLANETALSGLYQAVAVGDHGAWGATWNYSTQQTAEDRAVELCRENSGTNCRAVIWARNACIALAETTDRDGGFGWAWDESRDPTLSQAMRSCQSANPSASCTIAHQRCQRD